MRSKLRLGRANIAYGHDIFMASVSLPLSLWLRMGDSIEHGAHGIYRPEHCAVCRDLDLRVLAHGPVPRHLALRVHERSDRDHQGGEPRSADFRPDPVHHVPGRIPAALPAADQLVRVDGPAGRTPVPVPAGQGPPLRADRRPDQQARGPGSARGSRRRSRSLHPRPGPPARGGLSGGRRAGRKGAPGRAADPERLGAGHARRAGRRDATPGPAGRTAAAAGCHQARSRARP